MELKVNNLIRLSNENEQLTREKKVLEIELDKQRKINGEIQIKVSDLLTIKKRLSWIYILFPSILFLNIVITISYFILRWSIILFVIHLVLSVPIVLGSLVVIGIKLYRDKQKITNWLIERFSRNFLKCYIFSDNKKIISKTVMISNGQFNFNNGLYVVDSDTIYLDMDKNPIAFYKENIPNPLKFNFFKYITQYSESLDKRKVFDEKGDKLDLSYSSESLQKYKQDKLFNELHSTMGLNFGLIIGMMVFTVIIVVLILVLK